MLFLHLKADTDEKLDGLDWLALLLGAAICLGVSTSTGDAQGVAVTRCASRLAAMADPVQMSRTTARRHARAWCRSIEEEDRRFWQAIR